jgi:hypothetical protein
MEHLNLAAASRIVSQPSSGASASGDAGAGVAITGGVGGGAGAITSDIYPQPWQDGQTTPKESTSVFFESIADARHVSTAVGTGNHSTIKNGLRLC